MTIPKILHFTWKTKTLTRFAQKIWDDWARTHPDWEMRLWDDADIRALVADHYPAHLATFDGYPSGIFRADAFRFFVLHKFGGVYADLDVVPKGRIDRLCKESACFVGAEPEIHVEENDGRYRGMPFVLCNAFMGSEPGHPFWQRCLDAMARCSASSDVVDATGPRFVHGVAMCAPKTERPDALLPNLWSPLSGWGRHCPTSEAYADAVAAECRVIGRGEPALVSHLWRNSWFMPVFYKGPQFWKLPNKLQWWWRARRNPALSGTVFPAPSRSYADQRIAVPAELPNLHLAVDLTHGQAVMPVLDRLSYPADKLTIATYGGEAPGEPAARHNAMLAASQGKGHCVLVDGRLTSIPPGVLEAMVGCGRDVVTVDVVGVDGADRNDATLLYNADIFKALYRAGAREHAVALQASRNALPLLDFRYLNVTPMTVVGTDLLLVREQVVAAGVRFAETPYKYHRGAGGFALMARDRGFEVAALPSVTVVTERI
ncbi:hypothetical protein NIM87_09855 [Devosia sp. XJ19-1]|uniref:Glycosyl transferase n=1 Tax=Devosia ureilytica TaxID=2952754 RepID=A0A9Q4FT02_9HYPH|nr:glycosyltransferase [Devosia ureilytica]MCP8883802.1 hypothetical protein [Devosia ureilytica]MCP8887410.1 hypothetical protein [Devosia ureilytica]